MSVLDIIKDQTIIIDEWPPRTPKPIGYDHLPQPEKYDYIVRHRAVQQADTFIEKLSNSDDEIDQAQVAAVRFLLYYFRSVDPNEYIYTSKLQSYLTHLGFKMSIRTLRQSVIAALRDQSVFIVSTYSGIKLPYSVDDLYNFVSMVTSQTVPYLKRLELCRRFFLIATNGELDIVDPGKYPELAGYFSNGF
jgi:excinuclease UvrABC helicase subunit UvrB